MSRTLTAAARGRLLSPLSQLANRSGTTKTSGSGGTGISWSGRERVRHFLGNHVNLSVRPSGGPTACETLEQDAPLSRESSNQTVGAELDSRRSLNSTPCGDELLFGRRSSRNSTSGFGRHLALEA